MQKWKGCRLKMSVDQSIVGLEERERGTVVLIHWHWQVLVVVDLRWVVIDVRLLTVELGVLH